MALSRLSLSFPFPLASNVFNEIKFFCMVFLFFRFGLVFLNVNLLFGQRVAVAFRAVWALKNKTRQPEEPSEVRWMWMWMEWSGLGSPPPSVQSGKSQAAYAQIFAFGPGDGVLVGEMQINQAHDASAQLAAH